MKRMERILHPSDFSPASRAAFARALDMAKGSAATLLVVHVRAPMTPLLGAYTSPRTFNEIDRSARVASQKQLDALVRRARKAGVRAQSQLLLGTAPHVEIVRAARSKRADLIVMGTHGRSGLARLFLGSVTERVVATAPCPVLTVRGAKND